jgi:predicted transposase YdaD
VAVLTSLVIERDEALKARVPTRWQAIQSAPIAGPICDRLAEVLQSWLFERFTPLTAEEVLKMITHLIPLEETRAYRDIFSRGEAEGEVQGKAKTLLRPLRRRFGAVPTWAEQRVAAASTEQLDTWLDGIFDADGIVDLIGPADPPEA